MSSNNRQLSPRRVVVTGIGAVAPNGNGVEAYWESLRKGISGVGPITSFDCKDLTCRIAAEVKAFQPEDYLPPQDLKRVGRAVPLLLAATQEAFSRAKIQWEQLSLEERRSWGVVLGSGGGAPDFTEEQYRLFFTEQMRRVSAYNVSSSTMGNLSSEVSLRFELRGPSHVISTGCTSSTDAVGYAFNMIRFGLTDHLVSGGADATITAGIMQGFCVMRVLSTARNAEPTLASRPFDKNRDGFVLGEGAWVVILEEREAALTRGAPVFAEILGYGSTCDAYHRVRLDPQGEEPARAMTLAVQDAGLAKDEVGFIALHGTSTVLNDRTETVAAKRCFSRRAYDIPMSSVKSMIGHPQGASGAAGLVAAILAMKNDFLPPTINYEELDPECDLNYIPNEGMPRSVDVSLCNCIGFGSKNSALVISRGSAA